MVNNFSEDDIIVGMHSNWTYTPNKFILKNFLSNVYPYFKNSKVVKFLIVGKIETKVNLKNIVYTGWVKNIRSYVKLFDIGLVPIEAGAGIKSKVLDYMSVSKPMVITKIGAEGLKLTHNRNCLLSDAVDTQFRNDLSRLIESSSLRMSLGASAKKTFNENYSLKKIIKDVNQLYLDTLKIK